LSEVVPPTSNEPGPSVVPVDASATDAGSVAGDELTVKNKEQAEEIHRQLEKIDRLHANIAYLSGQLYEKGSKDADNKEGGKDAKIAQLLQEGGTLSKVEEKLRGDIKYLRIRLNEEKQTNEGVSKKLDKLDGEMRNLKIVVQTAEAREKAANDRLNSLHDVERELSNVKLEKAEAMKEMQGLGVLLEEAEQRAEDAEKKAQSNKLEEQKKVISDLNDQISDSKIERKLLEDRHKAELKELKDDHTRQLEQSNLSNLELKTEIQVSLCPTSNS
jgi:chromosome segregation ATPase